MRIEKRLDDYRLRASLRHGRKGAFELTGTAHQYRLKPEAGSCCGQTEVLHEWSTKRVCGRGRCKNRNPGKARNETAEELQPFATNLRFHPR